MHNLFLGIFCYLFICFHVIFSWNDKYGSHRYIQRNVLSPFRLSSTNYKLGITPVLCTPAGDPACLPFSPPTLLCLHRRGPPRRRRGGALLLLLGFGRFTRPPLLFLPAAGPQPPFSWPPVLPAASSSSPVVGRCRPLFPATPPDSFLATRAAALLLPVLSPPTSVPWRHPHHT
jgi:hypothetical protein